MLCVWRVPGESFLISVVGQKLRALQGPSFSSSAVLAAADDRKAQAEAWRSSLTLLVPFDKMDCSAAVSQKQPHSTLLASSSLDSISKLTCGLQDRVLWVLASIYLCVGGAAEQRMPCWEGARSRPRQEASQHSLCQVTELSLQNCCVPGSRPERVVLRKWIQ